MELVGAFVFPHGTITLDPATRDFTGIPAVLPTSKSECIKLHGAMTAAAEELIKTKPDLIIMSTPHGLSLEKEYLFYGNQKATGSAEWNGEWKDFKAEINLDSKPMKQLIQFLRDGGSAVELLTLGVPEDALNLRWAEVVPWWFITEAAKRHDTTPPPAIIFGQRKLRVVNSKGEIPDLLHLGNNMCKFLRSDESMIGKRVALVISSDLSHYHSKDPTSPYHYNENSGSFDQLMVNWSKLDYKNCLEQWEQLEQNLIKDGGNLADLIGSCGYTGLVFLHGFMKEYLCANGGTKINFKSNYHHYAAPTYYGMLSCSWIPTK